MEVVVMCSDLEKMKYNQRRSFIDTWIEAAKRNGCDRIIFDMGEKKVVVPEEPAKEHNELDEIVNIVRQYLVELCPDNDTISISATEPIPLAHTTTEDDKHVLDVQLLINGCMIMYFCDNTLVHTEEFESPGIMLLKLRDMTFDSLVADAELWCLPTYKDDKR